MEKRTRSTGELAGTEGEKNRSLITNPDCPSSCVCGRHLPRFTCATGGTDAIAPPAPSPVSTRRCKDTVGAFVDRNTWKRCMIKTGKREYSSANDPRQYRREWRVLCCLDKHCYLALPPAPPPSGGTINGSLAALCTLASCCCCRRRHTVHAGDNSTWLFWVLAVAVRVSPAYNIMAVDSARCCYLLLQSEAVAAVAVAAAAAAAAAAEAVAVVVVVVSEWAPAVLRAGAP
ncbi:hypothetical protein E2C01_038039 [Portunus trituberculatus]|uniref:Uncharacterized protein n=1 Tax=Portunus trituberculatus TaxID=210409 RepID=A0A5B7FG77_PORTR|nr:hypothetical protein [Portunus trituberculatus]